MKSAEEWSKEIGCYAEHCQGADEYYRKVYPEKIKEIQKDALKHAADIASYEIVPEVTEAANAQNIISNAIRSIANTL